MKQSRRKNLKQGFAVAGAAVAGVVGCDGTNVCDPPPPPLCDALDLDPMLRLSADRPTATINETILFTGKIESEQVETVGSLWIDTPAGQVIDQSVTLPDSISFRWSPREQSGGFRPGVHDLVPRLELRFRNGGFCESESDTVRLEIDSAGNARILSLPGSMAMATYFRTELEIHGGRDEIHLEASTSLSAERAKELTWRWRCSNGTLETSGHKARYIPDLSADSAVIQVEARLERGLAVSVWHWRRPR